MSFQAYLDNIESKTGRSPTDLLALAEARGLVEGGRMKADVKAGQAIDWLKADYDLGHGHAMAVVAYCNGKRD